jgi:hypothetical protein
VEAVRPVAAAAERAVSVEGAGLAAEAMVVALTEVVGAAGA